MQAQSQLKLKLGNSNFSFNFNSPYIDSIKNANVSDYCVVSSRRRRRRLFISVVSHRTAIFIAILIIVNMSTMMYMSCLLPLKLWYSSYGLRPNFGFRWDFKILAKPFCPVTVKWIPSCWNTLLLWLKISQFSIYS